MRPTPPLLALALVLSVACGPATGGAPSDGGGGDADAGVSDDAGSPADAGPEATDAGIFDAGPGDAGPTDAGPADGGRLDAGATDAGPAADAWAGHCDAPFTAPAEVDWNHPLGAGYATALGDPNHRVRDLVLAVGEAGALRGRFTYGTVDKDLEDEDVEVFVQTCPGWEDWGTARTDSDGIVWVDVPADLPKGDYRVRMVVLGDGTTADGAIAVWPPGVEAVVTDVDGTLTTSDWQAVQDVAFGPDAEMYAGADAAMQRWAEKGYRLVYLSGRPQFVNRYSRQWLERHAFPFGPIHLTEQAVDVIPTDSFVRTFKAEWIADLQTRVGVVFRAAYGNATTDIGAYDDAGIPKADTWIVGDNAGADGTGAIGSYVDHVAVIAGYPDAVPP